MSSVSKTSLVVKVPDKVRLGLDLKRHLSPKTVGLVLRALPLSGNAHKMAGGIVYLETGINSGVERPKKEFKKGNVAFLPAGGSICFFTQDCTTGRSMTPIGVISGDIEQLYSITIGDVISLKSD